MSNILIIKHGSLGDLIQANGAINDIKNQYKNSKVLLLTGEPYLDLMSKCPYIDGVLVDKRLPRWNIFYLKKLKNLLSKYKFTHVFDLQNSSRTRFYRKFLLTNTIWSSTDTVLNNKVNKKDFDKAPVLERMKYQLEKSGIKTQYINNINLSWAFTNIQNLLDKHEVKKYLLFFPFCSKKHLNKKWPFFSELIKILEGKYGNKYSLLIAPGPDEVKESMSFNCKNILDNGKPINVSELITLIEKSEFVISNDTGPAHIASHLNKKGLVLFGDHTSPSQVSIENNSFKALTVKKLSDLGVNRVLNEIFKILN